VRHGRVRRARGRCSAVRVRCRRAELRGRRTRDPEPVPQVSGRRTRPAPKKSRDQRPRRRPRHHYLTMRSPESPGAAQTVRPATLSPCSTSPEDRGSSATATTWSSTRRSRSPGRLGAAVESPTPYGDATLEIQPGTQTGCGLPSAAARAAAGRRRSAATCTCACILDARQPERRAAGATRASSPRSRASRLGRARRKAILDSLARRFGG